MADNVLVWLQKWYQSECDGDWEHGYGVSIQTLDNPGWLIKIELKNTALENITVESTSMENDENDWCYYETKDAVNKAAGDPNKLEFLLLNLRKLLK